MYTRRYVAEVAEGVSIGKVRLAKWFQTMPQKQKAKIVKDVTQLVLARRTRMCNFLEYKGVLIPRSCCASHLTRRASFRHEGRVSAIRFAVLRMRDRVWRQ